MLAALGRSRLLIPDDVRGRAATLEAAVLAGNWPAVKAVRGKFVFVLDETGTKRSTYLAGHPSLAGRMLFTNAEAGTPDAAFMILNDSIEDSTKIRELVRKGYIVRTRADADTKQAPTNDYQSFEVAQRCGAQIITTDYYNRSAFFRQRTSSGLPTEVIFARIQYLVKGIESFSVSLTRVSHVNYKQVLISHKHVGLFPNCQPGPTSDAGYSIHPGNNPIDKMAQLLTRDQNQIVDVSWIGEIRQQPVQRIFWFYQTPPNLARGGHRHQSGRMVLQCVAGRWRCTCKPNREILCTGYRQRISTFY